MMTNKKTGNIKAASTAESTAARSPFHKLGEDFIAIGKTLQNPDTTVREMADAFSRIGATFTFVVAKKD